VGTVEKLIDVLQYEGYFNKNVSDLAKKFDLEYRYFDRVIRSIVAIEFEELKEIKL
jgi:hypothetical protein